MHVDRKDSNPLNPRGDDQALEDDDRYYFFTAVVDQTTSSTSAPVTVIRLDGETRERYNQIRSKFRQIAERFEREQTGFIDAPETYTVTQQDRVLREIAEVGQLIHELFPPSSPVRRWLDQLIADPNSFWRTVTIITNDLSVPWYWLKPSVVGPFLCETCSLGMLQLSAAGRPGLSQSESSAEQGGQYEALLIKGASDLPFLDRELNEIEVIVQTYPKDKRFGLQRHFKALRASAVPEISHLYEERPESEDELVSNIRIVHLSGRFTNHTFLLSDRHVPPRFLPALVDRALVVLDGGSKNRGLTGWADMEELTSTLINDGAVGCVVTVLPVKHDPIVAKVFWEAFYHKLRGKTPTVGQALVFARKQLSDYFKIIGAPDHPARLAYQLIGNPAVQLCDESDKRQG